MRTYIRMTAPGGRFFLTLVTFRRAAILTAGDHVERLQSAIRFTMARHPFTIWGAVILPDHLHLLIELPPGDADFSTRVSLMKARFRPQIPETVKSRPADDAESVTAVLSNSRRRRREREVWQRRFWEHTIRDDRDFEAHMDYLHYNPVKHGLVRCPHAWPHSSLARWVRAGRYPQDWACSCERPAPAPGAAREAERTAGE